MRRHIVLIRLSIIARNIDGGLLGDQCLWKVSVNGHATAQRRAAIAKS